VRLQGEYFDEHGYMKPFPFNGLTLAQGVLEKTHVIQRSINHHFWRKKTACSLLPQKNDMIPIYPPWEQENISHSSRCDTNFFQSMMFPKHFPFGGRDMFSRSKKEGKIHGSNKPVPKTLHV